MIPNDEQIGEMLANSAKAMRPTLAARSAMRADVIGSLNHELLTGRTQDRQRSFWVIGGLLAAALILISAGISLFAVTYLGSGSNGQLTLPSQTPLKPTVVNTPPNVTSPLVEPDVADGIERDLNIGGLVDATAGGTIRVTVKFVGTHSPPKPLRVDLDPNCVAFYRDRPLPVDETLLVNEDDHIQNVVIFLDNEELEGRWPVQVLEPQIVQEGCRYSPHVLAVQTGSSVTIRNRDYTLHNVSFRDEGGSDRFSVALPVKDTVFHASYEEPELGAEFYCNVHSWMQAWLCVFDHPFFAISDEAGTVELRGVPEGNYEVAAWHEDPILRESLAPQWIKVNDGEVTEIVMWATR